jgi:ketopantoate reductase
VGGATCVAEIAPQLGDVLILGVKSFDTEGALREMAAAFSPDVSLICLQNRVANEEIAAKHFSRVWGNDFAQRHLSGARHSQKYFHPGH